MSSLIFFGSDQYSATALRTILSLPADSLQVHVVTDERSAPTPVEQLAKEHALPISYYPTTRAEMTDFVDSLKSNIWSLESKEHIVGLCASFDHLLPKEIIDLFGGSLYNLHPSLLPQYRNVSPVQYAIALGDRETGITLFRISTGIDNGEIIAQTSAQITAADTTATLTPRLFELGAQLFLDFLQGYEPCKPTPIPSQVRNLVFTRRLTRYSGYLEWPVIQKLLSNQPVSPAETTNTLLELRIQLAATSHSHLESSIYLVDLLRALTPWPGIWSLVPSTRGKLRITLESITPKVMVKLSGKPKAITLTDFEKYYLG